MKEMKCAVRLLCLVILCLFIAGCSNQSVSIFVLDENGKPIEGAEVIPMSLGMNYPALLTDSNGMVKLPSVPQEIKWVDVKKTGYQRLALPVEVWKNIEALTVTLRK
jgi:hypothetical protein